MTTSISRHTPLEIVSTEGMSEEEWLEWRRKGIGGSEVAAVTGLSPFMTARDLYFDKVGIKPAVDEEDNWIAKEVGHRLESLVAEIFCRKTGYKVFAIHKMFAHPEFPFMQANVDFFVERPDGSRGVLEIKTSNIRAKEKWDDESIPYNYELQTRHYMAVMDLDFAFVACLFGNSESDFLYRYLERDRDIEADIIAEEKYFWENYVQTGVEPPYTEDGDLVLRSIQRHYGPAIEGEAVMVLPSVLFETLEEITALRKQKAILDQQGRTLENAIKKKYAEIVDWMGTSCEAVCKGGLQEYLVSYSPRYRTSIRKDDLQRMKLQDPTLYDEYVTTTESRVFSLKKVSV